jgi:antitoxin ParD1/3/4
MNVKKNTLRNCEFILGHFQHHFPLTGITNSAIFVKLRSFKKKGAFLMQMNVSVTPELYELVQRMVQSGLYGNASEVVRDALRRMDERTIVDAAWSELNDKLGASAASGRSPYSVSEVISRANNRNDDIFSTALSMPA